MDEGRPIPLDEPAEKFTFTDDGDRSEPDERLMKIEIEFDGRATAPGAFMQILESLCNHKSVLGAMSPNQQITCLRSQANILEAFYNDI